MRAIERHEDDICRVIDHVNQGVSYEAALTMVASTSGLRLERLDMLTKTWAEIAEIPLTAGAAVSTMIL